MGDVQWYHIVLRIAVNSHKYLRDHRKNWIIEFTVYNVEFTITMALSLPGYYQFYSPYCIWAEIIH